MINKQIKMFLMALLVLMTTLVLVSCAKKPDPSVTFTLKQEEVSLQIGETYELADFVKDVAFSDYEGDQTNYKVNYTIADAKVIKIENNVIEALEGGETKVSVSVEGFEYNKEFTVKVQGISFDSEDEVIVGNSLRFTAHVGALVGQVTYSVSDETIATVEAGVLTALKEGKVTVTMTCDGHTYSKEINVEPICITNISTDKDTYTIKVGGSLQLEYTYQPSNAENKVSYTSSNDSVCTVSESGVVNALAIGSAKIIIKAQDKKGFEKEINIEVKEAGKATVSYANDYKEKAYLNWGKEAKTSVTEGITVTDPVYGDITDKFTIEGELNNKVRGTYNIKLVYDDGTGELIKIDRTVEVVWNYEVEFIGHAGSYFGIANTEAAFLYAARDLHYTAIECDLKRTKDGVFVMCHDDTFGGKTISSLTYAELSQVTATGSRTAGFPKQYGMIPDGGGQYSSKICTLERYLEICKEYGCTAIIELKSCAGVTNSDQSGMQALMNQIEKAGMLDQIIFLGSAYNCLAWTRSNGYGQVPCQYLVNSLDSQDVLDRCNTYNFDISTNVTAEPAYNNSEEWIVKYQEAGHKVSVWTFTQYVDYPTVQEWINKGVDYVTCDWQEMDKLVLPEKGAYQEVVKHTVRFYDYDGTLLKETKVVDGKTAAGPTNPKRTGYVFTEWDKAITNVTTDLDVIAQYRAIEYTVTFDKNLYTTEVSKWANKQAFVDEFYTDMYNWFKTNGVKLSTVTVEGDKVTMTKNGVTVTFSSVAELKAIDVYDYELTISNIIYKPVTRDSDGNCTMVVDENYFLNSSAYKAKYQELDKVLYETCVTNYSSYNRTYTPTSKGKIQIFFRFHQWTKGTSIPTLNKYFPASSESLINKYVVSDDPRLTCTLPDAITCNIDTELDIPEPTSNLKFLGWYDNPECTGTPITKLEKGVAKKNMTLYAKWELAD